MEGWEESAWAAEGFTRVWGFASNETQALRHRNGADV